MDYHLNSTSVLFYRHFDRYSGGQQKVFDYFSHLLEPQEFCPEISFSLESVWDETSPWFPDYKTRQVPFNPKEHDCLFLAGMDWEVYRAYGIDPEKPVVNLIQHVRHAVPGEDVYPFLTEKAIRICVSQQVQDAIDSTLLVNGPVFTIANGLAIPEVPTNKIHDLFITGWKNPAVAEELRLRLHDQDYDLVCQKEPLPREEFLALLGSAEITVLLPAPTEGFFLPALESMKLSTITIVPDCVGNRSFCRDFQEHGVTSGNCLMPEYNVESLNAACKLAVQLLKKPEALGRIRVEAEKTLSEHSLERECTQFLDIMNNIDQLW